MTKIKMINLLPSLLLTQTVQPLAVLFFSLCSWCCFYFFDTAVLQTTFYTFTSTFHTARSRSPITSSLSFHSAATLLNLWSSESSLYLLKCWPNHYLRNADLTSLHLKLTAMYTCQLHPWKSYRAWLQTIEFKFTFFWNIQFLPLSHPSVLLIK